MIKFNYKLCGICIVLAIIAIMTKSFAFAANDFLAYVNQSNVKPVLRNNTASSQMSLYGDTRITKSNAKITLSLKNSDVQPVLRMFADKAGLNIVFHESAKGNVTLDLVNVPLNDAFRMVLQITNLTYYLDGRTLVVSSSDFARSTGWSKQSMTTIPVNYVDAAMIANFLNQNIFSKNTPGLSNWDVVVTNAVANELLVFGTANDVAMAKKIVAKFDVPPINTTYTLKHTTPAEMATLVCNMLRMINGETDIQSDAQSWGESAKKGGQQGQGGAQAQRGGATGFAANIPSQRKLFSFDKFRSKGGVVTGFASSGGGSSSGGSSGGSSGSSSGGSALSLGTNIVACSVDKDGVTSGIEDSSDSSSSNSSSSSGSSSSSSQNSGSTNASDSIRMKSFGDLKMIVSYFPQRGTIQVTGGSKSQLKLISDFIKEQDVKIPQAYLDISVLELSEDGTKTFSNSWAIGSPNFVATFSGPDGATDTDPIIFGPQNNLYKATYPSINVMWYINYVVLNKKGRVVANPKIMLTSGQQSVIDLTEDYVEKVTAEIITSSSGSASGVQRTYDIGNDMGLKFTIVPFISPDGYVSLNIDASYKTLKDQQKAQLVQDGVTAEELVATLLNNRSINLKNVRIKDGETLVIGGLMKENESKNVGKIPFLGDIPLIGVVFRSTSTQKQKSEMLIMLTPKILKDAEDVGVDYNNDNDL